MSTLLFEQCVETLMRTENMTRFEAESAIAHFALANAKLSNPDVTAKMISDAIGDTSGTNTQSQLHRTGSMLR